MVISSRSWRPAKRSSSGRRAMPMPSSVTTSQSTPAGYSPARRARSTAASVWPARFSTPPSRARSTWRWPGRARSPGRVVGSISARMVAARSPAEMPVVVPVAVVDGDGEGGALRLGVAGDHERQVELVGPLVGDRRADQAGGVLARRRPSSPGVACSAAMMRSPSFSRSSSSTTTTIPPRPIAATASSMLDAIGIESATAVGEPRSACEQPLDVLGHHVDLEVDAVAWALGGRGW